MQSTMLEIEKWRCGKMYKGGKKEEISLPLEMHNIYLGIIYIYFISIYFYIARYTSVKSMHIKVVWLQNLTNVVDPTFLKNADPDQNLKIVLEFFFTFLALFFPRNSSISLKMALLLHYFVKSGH